jgi:DNA-binding transcriptional regulator YiaG
MLPEEITRVRALLGLSMSGLAQELGVHPHLIVDWESGEKFPTKKHHEALMKLQQRLGKDSA